MLYKILPFNTDGGQIPALHDLKRNAHKLAFMNLPELFFKPDKKLLILKRYPKWLQYIQTVNNKAAFQYIRQLKAGVFVQGWPRTGFQPAIFASSKDAPNTVNILKTFEVGSEEWGEVECMDVRKAPQKLNQLWHRYVAEGMDKPNNSYLTDDGNHVALYPAPKASGNVFSPLISDGDKLYIQMAHLAAI